MGSVGRVVAAVATGGLSEVGRAVLPEKVYNPVASALSLGVLDVIERGEAPFTGVIRYVGPALGMDESDMNWLEDVSADIFSGGFAQLPKAYKAATEDGGFDVWKGIDRLVDPAGTIDYSLRKTGDILYDIAPDVVRYVQPIGATVGGIVGSYVPVIGTAAGAAIGSGIGSKIGAGTRTEDYGRDFVNAGISYGAGAATQGLGNYVSGSVGNYTPGSFVDMASTTMPSGVAGATGSQAVGNVAGKVVEGAAKGAIGQIPAAYEQGSIEPLAIGAGLGGVGGALSGSAGEIYGGITSPDIPNDFYTNQAVGANLGTISDMATGVKTSGTIGDFYNQGGAGLSELSGQTLPQVEVNPELKYAAWLNPITDYTMGGAVNEPKYNTTITPQDNPGEYKYNLPTFYDPDNPDVSLWDKVRGLMGEVGKIALNSNLGKLGQQIGADGQPYYVEGEEGRAGSSTSDESVDTIMTRIRGAESAKKAKKSGFVEVLDPSTGLPILFSSIGEYKEETPEQKLYS